MPIKPTMKGDIVLDQLRGFGSPLDQERLEDLSQEELYRRALASKDPIEREALIMEIRLRGLVPLEWYPIDVLRYIKFDEIPAKTPSGLWVKSLLRDTRNMLTFDEIVDYLRGDIELPPLVHEVHIPVQLRAMLEGSLGTSVRHWSSVEILNFATFDQRPLLTMRGVYRNSPIRDMKSADQWLDAELLDWIEGYIEHTPVATEPLLLQELRQRFYIPNDWSREEIVIWVADNIVPEHTMDGMWVNSQVRMEKTVAEWTTHEIVAYAQGKISVEPERERDLMREIRSRYFYPSTVSDEAIRVDIRTKGIHIDENSEFVLREVVEAFILGVSEAKSDIDAAYVHAKFLQELRRVMTVPLDTFHKMWTSLLDIAAMNEAVVFNDVSVFRGFDLMTATKLNRESYSQLLLLIINTMHLENRHTIVNLRSFLEPIKFPGARDNLYHYYGLC